MESSLSFASQPQHLAIEDKEILKDCASCSQVLLGNFTGSLERKEAVFLRGNDTLELYDVTGDKFEFHGRYEMLNTKCLEIRSLKMSWKPGKEAVVMYVPQDKLITLEWDLETAEFKVLAMHNFENQSELEDSGKRFPMRGKLRSMGNRVGYLSDDYTWVNLESRADIRPREQLIQRIQSSMSVSNISLQKTKSVTSLNN